MQVVYPGTGNLDNYPSSVSYTKLIEVTYDLSQNPPKDDNVKCHNDQ